MPKERIKPIEFMIQFKEIILQAYQENQRSSEKTWIILESNLPKLQN
ncbi:hypothetical protein MHK_009362 [Candidatus Magnetomorum sp. HK-1]|nr:hypothetical protein MHK_009362 [Candidatus Magnetomorum sp. HK-1]